jgi:hypothetical protein
VSSDFAEGFIFKVTRIEKTSSKISHLYLTNTLRQISKLEHIYSSQKSIITRGHVDG